MDLLTNSVLRRRKDNPAFERYAKNNSSQITDKRIPIAEHDYRLNVTSTSQLEHIIEIATRFDSGWPEFRRQQMCHDWDDGVISDQSNAIRTT